MNELTVISNKLDCSKGTLSTGFSELYYNYFNPLRDKKINILEIGVGKGRSLKVWKEFFKEANIVGLDYKDKTYLEEDRIKTYLFDQSKIREVDVFREIFKDLKFDIIIDDGSHHFEDQQKTFILLFDFYLKDKGLYIIEDLHTSNYKQGSVLYKREFEFLKNRKNTTLNYLKHRPLDSVYSEKDKHIDNLVLGDIEILSYNNCHITSIINKK